MNCLRPLALVGMLVLVGAQGTKRPTVSANYMLEIDGVGTAMVTNVAGGYLMGDVVTTPSGTGAPPQKQIGSVRVVPVTADVAPGELSAWISQALSGNAQPVSGRIVEMDFNYTILIERQFHDARLTEVVFPGLDASSKEAARVTLTFQPQRITTKKGDGSKASGVGGKDAKRATASAFRVSIPGVDCTSVAKVEPITIKFAETESASTGAGAGAAKGTKPQAGSPTAGDLVLSIAAEKATDFAHWAEDTLANVGGGQEKEKTVKVELLAPDMKSTLFTLEGNGVGIYTLRPPSGGGADQLKRVQAQMYVERWQQGK